MAQPTFDDRLILPRFQAALLRYPDLPSDATHYRWRIGMIPPAIRFLVEHPDLLAALMEDAQTINEGIPQAA